MRDIRGDLQDRASFLEEQINGAQAQFEKLIEQLTREHQAKVDDLQSELEAVTTLIEVEYRRLTSSAPVHDDHRRVVPPSEVEPRRQASMPPAPEVEHHHRPEPQAEQYRRPVAEAEHQRRPAPEPEQYRGPTHEPEQYRRPPAAEAPPERRPTPEPEQYRRPPAAEAPPERRPTPEPEQYRRPPAAEAPPERRPARQAEQYRRLVAAEAEPERRPAPVTRDAEDDRRPAAPQVYRRAAPMESAPVSEQRRPVAMAGHQPPPLADFLIRKLSEIGAMTLDDLCHVAVQEGYFAEGEIADRAVHVTLMNVAKAGFIRQLPNGTFAPATVMDTIRLRRAI